MIEASFFGTGGGARFRNVNGSFYDFVAERFDRTSTALLAQPPDPWGGRAAAEWAVRLRESRRFDPSIEHVVDVAAVLDAIYRA